MTEHEASARLVESFYPVRTENSHVLLLSPQVELSPLYYHYVIYNLLQYKYSAYSAATTKFPNLMGFSLELPSFHLNDTKPLEPPLKERTPLKGEEKGLPAERTPFLWQAPNANAALYFGDKWIEFHSFLSARLAKPPSTRRKVYSQKHPSWLESLLELIRARGYSMLYPNFPAEGDAIVSVHDELYQVPEEYTKDPSTPSTPVPNLDPDIPLVAENTKEPRSSPPNREHPLLESDLLSLLLNDGELPDVADLPLLSYNGIRMSSKLSHEAAMAYSETYRREIGTCTTDAETTPRAANNALDLFCNLDDIYDPFKPYQPPHHTSASLPTREPANEDVISTEHHADAKQESSAHLARQGGQPPGPVHPSQAPPAHVPQQDDSAETQNEFKLQMERQAKQAQGTATAGELIGEAPNPGIPAAIPPGASPAPVVAAVQNHDSFTKQQPPPKAIEDPEVEIAQEKGTGW